MLLNIYCIPEYWVIDLVNKKLIVHTQPGDGGYSQRIEYQAGQVTPQAFSNVEISLEQLLLF